MNKYVNAAISVITSPYILKDTEAEAFGVPFYIHRNNHIKEYQKWKTLKNVHMGDRCFIIGTGPSLNLDDLPRLQDELTFSCNSIVKFFPKTSWRPTYYCIVDPRVYDTLESNILAYPELKCFYPTNRIKNFKGNGIGFPLNCCDMYRVKEPRVFRLTEFGSDPMKCFYDGATVVYSAMQIAVYMGFKTIYLMGVDCNYGYSKNFHNKDLEYNSKDYKYRDTKNTGLIMIEAFKIAKEYCDNHGIEIINLNHGGMLDVFPRKALDEVIN